MIKQGIVNNSILEKKFKILRTSIMLGNITNREEVMETYEETAKEVDKLRRDVYEELLASKMYTTKTLEEERDRLKDLITFTEDRINARNDFIDDYIKITNNFLDDLPKVSNEDELISYKIRLDNIDEYLNNCEEIKELNAKLKEKRKELEEKYENKASSEIINSKLEDELIDEFNKIMLKNEYYASLNYTDIDSELLKIESHLEDKKEVMNTFISSYDALKNAGISGAEREEYLSYVADSKKDYYQELEKKYMLNVYKLVLDKESDYDLLYQKREYLNNILKERLDNRRELEITARDDLEYFQDICNEQFSIIKSQKINMENIDKLIASIADCESRLEELDAANSRDEITDILREYSETKPDVYKAELPDQEEVREEVIKKEIENSGGPKPSNMVVKINEPVKINVKNAKDTAKLVMKKVVIVLEPKRFNTKKDKLKEAEKELALEKQLENIEVPTKEDKDDTFVTMDVDSDTKDTNDDVFISTPDNNINIVLDTDTSDDKVVKTITPDEIKVHVPSDDFVSVPTEIFVEETREKPLDLFSQTDPFLDDNQFEISDNVLREDSVSNMPKTMGIGTVRPTSMLSQIEAKENENDDIILPTMGLTDNNKTDVPIVSENYLN